jgi:hypothetical protein
MSRRTVLLSILSSVVCLAYFYMLDSLFFSSAYFAPIFQLLLTGYDLQVAWVAVAVCILAALWNRPAPILLLVNFLARHPLGVASLCVMLTALGSIIVYHQYPLSMDEYAAVFQSKIFASGHLFAQLPPSAIDWLFVPGFNGSFLIASRESGRAIEGYWPGFALLLAPFEFFGAPWLCNALLAGLAIYLIYRITIDATGDRQAAGWAILFCVASGAYFANAISYYSMQAHLTMDLLFAWLLLNPTRTRVFAAGLVGSFALVLHNPFPHALFAIPWITAFAVDGKLRPNLGPLILGYLPVTLGVGLGWIMLRNSITPVSHGASVVSALANGAFKWTNVQILNMRVAGLAKTCVWAVPGIFVFAVLGRMRHRDNWYIGLLTQSVMLTFVGYFFVNLDQGHGWGYRYFHSAWGVIPILAACAMTDSSEANPRLTTFAGAACILSMLVIVPMQMHQIEHFMSRHLALLPSPKRPGNNVFFVSPSGGFYLADMIQIDPLLRTPDLLLASQGSRLDAELMRRSWPNAKKIGEGAWGQQWYLAPIDQRRSNTAGFDDKKWVFDLGAPGRPE